MHGQSYTMWGLSIETFFQVYAIRIIFGQTYGTNTHTWTNLTHTPYIFMHARTHSTHSSAHKHTIIVQFWTRMHKQTCTNLSYIKKYICLIYISIYVKICITYKLMQAHAHTSHTHARTRAHTQYYRTILKDPNSQSVHHKRISKIWHRGTIKAKKLKFIKPTQAIRVCLSTQEGV